MGANAFACLARVFAWRTEVRGCLACAASAVAAGGVEAAWAGAFAYLAGIFARCAEVCGRFACAASAVAAGGVEAAWAGAFACLARVVTWRAEVGGCLAYAAGAVATGSVGGKAVRVIAGCAEVRGRFPCAVVAVAASGFWREAVWGVACEAWIVPRVARGAEVCGFACAATAAAAGGFVGEAVSGIAGCAEMGGRFACTTATAVAAAWAGVLACQA
jgi:hypothetical protein